MTVLVDTGVLYADRDIDASRHDAASAALEATYDREFGVAYVTDYIYDEAVTLTLKRTGSFPAAKRIGQRLRGVDPYPSPFELLRVSGSGFADAVDVFERYDDQELSFTDATTVSVCERRGIDHVLSFDDDFDGVVNRIDPNSV